MPSVKPFGGSEFAAACRGRFPQRKVNGGLYTGEPFHGDWGNGQFFPDQGFIANQGVFRGGFQTPSGQRPYNTSLDVSGRVFVPELNSSFPSQKPN